MEREKIRFWTVNIGAAFLSLVAVLTASMLVPIINSVIPGKLAAMIFLSLVSLGIGALYTRIFRGSNSFRKIVSGVTGSTMLALSAAYSKIVYSSLKGLSLTVGEKPANRGFEGIINTESMIQPDLLFLTLMISFNLPIIYTWSQGERKLEHLLLYLIPIVVFLIIPAVFSGLLSGI